MVEGSALVGAGLAFRFQGSDFRVQGRERILIELMTSGRELKASREGSKSPPCDPTVGLCLGPDGSPRGGALSYERPLLMAPHRCPPMLGARGT